ncbi:cell division protein ZapA [Hanamia caeni]|jgi:cell division protein ZapA|uniref:Cell division protein ZapA n=1 Tax=Hanamia caeni TaxID=2294116 RepID=A0A3M9NHI3_9BACT|nr:cell division protein ZapA [Hanamia caeni]RNI37244.1 cell division protein ZapA [Hanamia caeni]
MAGQQLIPLNIVIADRNYRIKILPADEETVRKVLKTINEKILEFKTQFAGKDMQDYISMVLIWYATQAKEDNSQILNDELASSLLKMEKQLDEALQ